ncbi:MAG: tRNA (N(6)-L-threonylcarbamoyladenosine(37)-C(2))-methylthiotransferase MtaB [Candidatus Omnitrophica bacterium]|nr:tRNA (N(6)-L-threonylcarbamoyladenosine(37)-C(2))-methylthiotransferase MtaB [Candidatus Omnitrophota bacterium]
MNTQMDSQLCQKVKFQTLGCRLNQYETQAIREQFAQAGFEETQDDREAGVYVLNTCTVTRKSDKENRYLIRKFHRANPDAKIVVTGCYVEGNEAAIKALPGVSLTVLNRQKSEIVNLLESCTSFSLAPSVLSSKRRYTPLSISQFEGRTRAYIKVQDGCNHACSFCKVVLVRGPARSRPMEEVIDEAKRLAGRGFKEVVLTGIQLGSYGYDLAKRQMLVDILERLSQIPELKRIRLSSIEPTDVTRELIEAMATMEKVCPHLHIPLQSGDSRILERMNRRYRRDFYDELVQSIRARVNHFLLTTDVMVGFPGEGSFEFDQTVDLLSRTKPYKLHIFPYSAREGTRSARFQDFVKAEEMNRREEILFSLEEKLRENNERMYLGRTLNILVEESTQREGWASGHAENYLKIHFPFAGAPRRILLKVRAERIENGELIGSALAPQGLSRFYEKKSINGIERKDETWTGS